MYVYMYVNIKYKHKIKTILHAYMYCIWEILIDKLKLNH